MILNEETKLKYKYDTNQVLKFSSNLLVIKCDYCGEIFDKESVKVFMARKNSKSEYDVCSKKECIVAKRELTMEKKYGTRHALSNNLIKEKRRTTCIKNDVYNTRQKRLESSNLEKYGVKNVFSIPEIKDRLKKTQKKKYGGMGFSSDSIREKIHTANLEKYGAENFQSTEKFKEKVKTTNRKKYEVDWYMSSDNFKQKSKKKLLEKYSVENYNQTDAFKERLRKITFDKMYEKIISNNRISELYIPLFSREEYKGVNEEKYKFQCKICNNEFLSSFDNGHFPYCNHCYPTEKTSSSYESEIFNFIHDELKITSAEKSNRTVLQNNMELDIFCPIHMVAIELNGNYWHSEIGGKKSKEYHLNKTLECERKNIHLIHIFEDEWVFNRDKIKQKIKLLFSSERTYIHARKCNIKILTKDECDLFLDNHHLQKSCISKIRLGLFHENQLVSVMTFGPSRFEKNTNELLRYASSIRINGGFNKLLKHYRQNYFSGTIISYADRRWTNINKNVYLKNGFQLESSTSPNYYYVNKTSYLHRKNRMNYQKHKLKEKLRLFDPVLTEWENMQLNGFDRIWDCGQLKYKI